MNSASPLDLFSNFTAHVDGTVHHYDYIMGNPPFVGFTYMTAKQKANMQYIFLNVKKLDFVCAWYKKASDLIQSTNKAHVHCVIIGFSANSDAFRHPELVSGSANRWGCPISSRQRSGMPILLGYLQQFLQFSFFKAKKEKFDAEQSFKTGYV